MTTSSVLPAAIEQISERVGLAVRDGLASRPKSLPSWLFYDEAGSRLFEQITELPEYYLTRVERSILTTYAQDMITQAAEGQRLRIAELGAGSAEKTRLLLRAAIQRQVTLVYEPVDVSLSALEEAQERIEREIPGVHVALQLADYTHGLELKPAQAGERRLVLYIGSSIGNFEPQAAGRLLEGVRVGLKPGDGLLLGVDLAKSERTLVSAYDDAAGVTAAFNHNLLVRLNRELGADFDPQAFEHRAIWNPRESRMEMHLVSRFAQRVRLGALDCDATFSAGEGIHTENSYKYRPGQAEAMLAKAGFTPVSKWTDARGWFAVYLGRVE
jgi:dimethylhistidine N-methyltransferase